MTSLARRAASADSATSTSTSTGAPALTEEGNGEILETLRAGDRGEQVGILQRQLTDNGFGVGRVDSAFGRRTTSAVRDAQAAAGQSVTGVADPTFRRTLVRGIRRPTPPVGEAAAAATSSGESSGEEAAPTPTTAPAGVDEALRAQIASEGGITLAIYVVPQREGEEISGAGEFRARAQSFARDHRALAIDGGTLRLDRAIPAPDAATVAASVRAVYDAASALLGRRAPVQTLALFAHGFNDGVDFGGRIGRRGDLADDGTRLRPEMRTQAFVDAIEGALSGAANVVLYACSTGSAGGSDDGTGEGSFADELRDRLTSGAGDERRAVWGHTTAAHTTGNTAWRGFEGRQEDGEAASSDATFGGVANDVAVDAIVDALRGGHPAASSQISRRMLRRWVARELPFAVRAVGPATDAGSVPAATLQWWIRRFDQHQPTDRDY